MLNALRHQRKNHARDEAAVTGLSECSTPCGINGKTTKRPEVALYCIFDVLNALRHQRKNHRQHNATCRLGRVVLNALRHQRKNHAPDQENPRTKYGCSTPCGINGKTTGVAHSLAKYISMCSTPCGINGKTTQLVRHCRCCVRWCSTPCGINGKTTGLLFNAWIDPFRAQRLAASTEKPPYRLDKL